MPVQARGHLGFQGVLEVNLLAGNKELFQIPEVIPLSNVQGDMDYGVIFPGQCQSNGMKEKRGFHA